MEGFRISPSDLKVTDLKKELEKRSLSKSGNKAQLIDRLRKNLEKDGQTLESVFGAQVCAQKSSAAVSGLDMERWCSQIVKKDSATPTPAATSTPPIISPVPPASPPTVPQLAPVATVQQPAHEVAFNNHSGQIDGTVNALGAQPQFSANVKMETVPQFITQPEEVPVTAPSQQVILEPPAVAAAASPLPFPPATAPPVQQQVSEAASPQPIVLEEPAQPPIIAEVPPVDVSAQQPAYNEAPLLLESDGDGRVSPLIFQEHDRLTEPDESEEHAAKLAPATEDSSSQPPPVSRSAIDPEMLIPRHQLRSSQERLAELGPQSADGLRKRKWSEEIKNKEVTKSAIISTESLKLMNLPEVSDVEDETETGAEVGSGNDEAPSGPRRRRLVAAAASDAAENATETAEAGKDEEGGGMDTLELLIDEKTDDLGDGEGNIPLYGSHSSIKGLSHKTTPPTPSTAPLVALEVDEPRRAKRQVSPARSEPTNILHIENLVRPFSLGQLKELLSRVGTVDESLFWTDKIKSHCIVGYTSVEDAEKTREALHGTQWPSTNPKILNVEFVTPDFLDRHKSMEEGSTRLTGASIGGIGIALGGRRLVKGSISSDAAADSDERSSRLLKSTVNGNSADSHQRQRLVRTVENNHQLTEDAVASDEQTEEVDQAKSDKRVSLDDLFRRTKTSPHLYWLPLTEENVERRDAERAERERQRQEREKEREKEREQEREKQRERQKEREREREREREQREREREQRERERQKEREREREQRERERQQREREREQRDRERQRSSYRSSGREGSYRRSSSDRGRRRSPSEPRRRPGGFRDPVTPPPFRSCSRSRRSSSSRSSSSISTSRSRSRSASTSSGSSRSSRSSSPNALVGRRRER